MNFFLIFLSSLKKMSFSFRIFPPINSCNLYTFNSFTHSYFVKISFKLRIYLNFSNLLLYTLYCFFTILMFIYSTGIHDNTQKITIPKSNCTKIAIVLIINTMLSIHFNDVRIIPKDLVTDSLFIFCT